MRDTSEAYSADITAANTWLQKTLDTREKKAAAAALDEPEQPPPPLAVPAGTAVRPHFIRIGGLIQMTKLVSGAMPVRPASATGSPVVRIELKIAKDGQVQDVCALAGDRQLIPLAIEAARQWQFRPTLLDGEPVEVR